ncbi:MAG: S8 family serine peptidase, partial [Pyrinomonadaceae bacterium]|nr:S8 family serine peptidase [Pyrinomonadaceae bacterium]
MKRKGYSIFISWLTCVSMLLSLCAGILVSGTANAAPQRTRQRWSRQSKVASDLRKSVNNRRNGGDKVDVILQLNGEMSPELEAMLRSSGVRIRKHFNNFGSTAVQLPAGIVDSLADFPEVDFVSEDGEVKALGGHVAQTTGANDARAYAPTGSFDGAGVGIAIVDSGIYSAHVAFLNAATNTTRIVKSVDFTGDGRTDDPYGHGTHVAAAAAGNGMVSSGKYIGIAPQANIVNLRVLNSQGIGTVSGLLSALDWIYTNRTTYNIRVVNLSLGLLALTSYEDDPVCLAARRLANAGVVVVAAAGNNGKNSAGQKIYGQIHSPGNEPSVITVGAVNTFGTDNRADDKVATYSSRGPTRSYSTDTYGVKHFDNLVKPDLVAPGNKLVFAEAPNSVLLQQNAGLDAGVSTTASRKQMILSGTSVAAPLVAGAAALMLQANPTLTPNMVRMLLMYTSQQLANFNTLEQGAGQLNVDGAVLMAKAVRTTLNGSTPLNASLLSVSAPNPQTSISYGVSNFTFSWAQGIVFGNSFLAGPSLIT